jgi:protein-disulfide isomerase
MALEQQLDRDLRFVFRHFPLTEVHPHAQMAAESAEFGGAHGRFWEMHDAIYEREEELDFPLLLAITDALGLSTSGLRTALQNGVFVPKVREDFLSGVRSGVNGTPTFFINGKRHDGSFEFDELAMAITAEAHAHRLQHEHSAQSL